ncbi:flagellar hook-associated protein 2 [Clostridium butyricum]|uniref:Flagellar hook-associated protein 2 n=1 Tax=Clostridium butyricum TaxID=1492 RepID=A0A512TIT4_CLOBU|nr:flagellar filament capping protein FliD [Clostridium butyricum]NOW23163.1 flagellar hook-associated protein 2 [Clostridium butyricum]GEQ20109.1 flagellar hook-associated protein 2 [Clostridium butyricum]
MTSIYSSSSTNSSTNSANLLRISGMASGIDTDSVVKSMVSSYQTKIDKANQAKQTLQWKQEIYRDIIKDIKGLQDYFDPLSSKYILSGKSLNINTAATDNSAIVSATSGSTAKAGTYNVKVSQLATQAKIDGTSKNSMVKVNDLANWKGNVLDFGGTDQITISSDITSVSDLAADINKKLASTSLNGKISASYVNDGTYSYIKFVNSSTTAISLDGSDLGGSTTVSDIGGSDLTINSGISSSTKLSDLGITTTNDMKFNLSYDSTTTTTPILITAKSTDTLQNLMDKVNSATSGAVVMSIDDTTGKISFQSKKYGSTSNLKITDSSVDSNLSKLGITAGSASGKDAIVAITAPGQAAATTITQSSNQFTVNGVSYNIVGVNNTTGANITVTANSDTVVSNMKKFIEDYNSVISKINKKLTEKKDSDYSPLTDAQKEEMSETQITTWETKAKVGILRNDDYLSNLMTQLRGIFSSPVYSSYNSSDSTTGKVSLSFGNYGTNSIGIDTSTDYTDGGQLILKDEAKLKSAIENNLDDFKKLFIGASDSTLNSNESYTSSEKYKEDGIFRRMDNILRDYVAAPGLGDDGTYSLSGYMNIYVNKQYDYSTTGSSGKNTLPDQVYSKTLSISKFQTQLSDAQTRYYAKFTALETAMNSLNSQQSTLSSMLGTS